LNGIFDDQFSKFPDVVIDLFTKPENKATWPGVARTLQKIRRDKPENDDLRNLIKGEVERVYQLPLARIHKQTSTLNSFLLALNLKEEDKQESDSQSISKRLRTVELFFDLFLPKATKEEDIKERAAPKI
jgi:hypothetical protein